MRTLRILQHERRTDEIRIGRTFNQNNRSFGDIAEEVIEGYAKRSATDLDEYYSRIAIVDEISLKTIYVIHPTGTQPLKQSDHGQRP